MKPARKIIILEDDPIFLFRLKHMLEDAPFELTTCGTIKECTQLIESNKFDCAILDYNLPDGKSTDIVEMVQERDMATLVLSAAKDQQVVRDVFVRGCFDFISKAEITKEILKTAIEKTLSHSDILTERRQHKEDLESFVRTVAHDLKTPLSSLNGYLYLTRMAIEDEDKTEMLESITAAENSSKDMANLINALLEYTRLGKSFKPEKVELNAVIETIRKRANQLIRENQAKIITAPNPLPNVIGDMNLLTQIFQNLITNSIKYRSEEPPVIKVSVEVDPDNPAKAEISIADNGLGIDPAYHKKIFQPLERALATTQEGHGIGLATCKTIAERHCGEIWVESQVARGSTFSFTLNVKGS